MPVSAHVRLLALMIVLVAPVASPALAASPSAEAAAAALPATVVAGPKGKTSEELRHNVTQAVTGEGMAMMAQASAGYTIINDVTARDLQKKHQQWFKGKSLDTFCPMGPMLVTADEIPDPQALSISLRVNGQTRQSSHTSKMIFPVAQCIEVLSNAMTLLPGDIIATGTPEGERASWELVHFIRRMPQLTADDLAEMEKANPISREQLDEQKQIDDFLNGGEPPPPPAADPHAAHKHQP